MRCRPTPTSTLATSLRSAGEGSPGRRARPWKGGRASLTRREYTGCHGGCQATVRRPPAPSARASLPARAPLARGRGCDPPAPPETPSSTRCLGALAGAPGGAPNGGGGGASRAMCASPARCRVQRVGWDGGWAWRLRRRPLTGPSSTQRRPSVGPASTRTRGGSRRAPQRDGSEPGRRPRRGIRASPRRRAKNDPWGSRECEEERRERAGTFQRCERSDHKRPRQRVGEQRAESRVERDVEGKATGDMEPTATARRRANPEDRFHGRGRQRCFFVAQNANYRQVPAVAPGRGTATIQAPTRSPARSPRRSFVHVSALVTEQFAVDLLPAAWR